MTIWVIRWGYRIKLNLWEKRDSDMHGLVVLELIGSKYPGLVEEGVGPLRSGSLFGKPVG